MPERSRRATVAAESDEPLEASPDLLGSYRRTAGVFDELIDHAGGMRPHWRPFFEALSALGQTEILRRSDAVARRLREAGVFYRLYGAERDAEQPWPLSFVPVIIDTNDWRAIEAGLVQRARLMEATLADFYGAQTLIADGSVPPAVVAGSPDFLRPLVGVKPRGGRFLRFYAADLGRGPDGRWWVIGDRTQAPSGAGYALGNRLALARILPETIRDLDVRRLAGFFQAFRLSLSALSQPRTAGVCLLTPGPFNETYYEHSYLARYLGFLLIEGEDLVVRGDEVYLRTVAGLKHVDVLLRRLDADFADPLELNPHSQLGAPGLARAARAGSVAFANALGSGLVESRALMSLWPKLAERLLGETLLIPNIATWWSGQDEMREHVVERLAEMAIAPAFVAERSGLFRDDAISGESLSARERDALIARIRARGADYVGQELVRLSTTPVWRDGTLVARPFLLRVFLAATDEGWTMMPGGFCRVSHDTDPRAISLQRGGVSADAWVLSDGTVQPASLLPTPASVEINRPVGSLTSRTADNMFWLGRYLERAEATLRLVRAMLSRASERDPAVQEVTGTLVGLATAMGALAPREDEAPSAAEAALEALEGTEAVGAAPVIVERALRAASTIRDRLSPDAWRTINDLAALLSRAFYLQELDALDRTDRALRELAAFAGLEQENMTRSTGWAILEIGRRLERGLTLTRFCAELGLPTASSASLEALLELADSQMTYARRYFVTASPIAVADLLLFDEANPRSCAFQARRLRTLADSLPESARSGARAAFRKSTVLLEAELAGGSAASADAAYVGRLSGAFLKVANAFARLYLTNRNRLAPPGPTDL